jgi:hypothetical protein
MKKVQKILVLKASATRISMNRFAVLRVTGGSGSGAIAYATRTPTVCSVDIHALVRGVKAGACILSATKASDGIYLNAISARLVLTFVALSPPPPPAVVRTIKISGVKLMKLIQVNLGSTFGMKKVVIKIRAPKSKIFKTLCVVTLNKLGMVRTTRSVPTGSTVEVLVGGKSKAVTKVA